MRTCLLEQDNGGFLFATKGAISEFIGEKVGAGPASRANRIYATLIAWSDYLRDELPSRANANKFVEWVDAEIRMRARAA